METIQPNTHLSDQLLELYVGGRLPAEQVAILSEHMFECDECHERYELEVQFRTAFREARPRFREQAATKAHWWQFTAWPAPVWAGAAAMVLVIALLPVFRQPGAPVLAELTAFRSGSSLELPARRILNLRLDSNGLDAIHRVRLELADSAGKPVWTGSGVLQSSRWEATVDRSLSAGRYWVRAYEPATGEMLREYALLLK